MGRPTLFGILLLVQCLLGNFAWAHPMDLAQLKLVRVDERIVADLKLHRLAAEHFLSIAPANPALDSATALFRATLESVPPQLNQLNCQFLTPEFSQTAGDSAYLNLRVVITCPKTIDRAMHFVWALPFLQKATDAFQLMATFSVAEHPVTLIANPKNPRVEFGESSQTFMGFVTMGMCHIGACASEWRDRNGDLHTADGIDHILFIIALVLAGGGLWRLAKTATGFTLGHSITLALSTYKIVHIHSKWIEVGIAFSIAYIAGRAAWTKGSRAESWLIAGLFGVVHGLGFSSALQDLELKPTEVLTALAGFNIGVELGQCVFIALTLASLGLLYKTSPKLEEHFRRAAAFAICLTGLCWVYSRGFT